MCPSCLNRNLGLFSPKGEPRKHEVFLLSGFLESRFRGNDTLGLARLGKGPLLPSAKMLPKRLSGNRAAAPNHFQTLPVSQNPVWGGWGSPGATRRRYPPVKTGYRDSLSEAFDQAGLALIGIYPLARGNSFRGLTPYNAKGYTIGKPRPLTKSAAWQRIQVTFV